MKTAVAALALCAGLSSVALAVPTNTTLPGGWSWAPLAGGSFTSSGATARGGANGQTTGPFTDTSFGVMDETGTPWFTGGDLTAQQYVQRQVFGNFGTSSPPGPAGARYFNFGYQGSGVGSNFPRAAFERRDVTLNHWNNAFPDAGGVATLNQIVYVPVSATLSVGLGWGGDEMLLRIIGGNGGQRSQFFVDATLNAEFTTGAFGGLSSTNNSIRTNAVVQANDGGSGSYDVAWGFGASNASQVVVNRVGSLDSVNVEGVQVGDPSQGVGPNSVGHGFTKTYDVLSALVQNGGTFGLDFTSGAEIVNLVRDFGNADARATLGPGFEGNATLTVQWAAFQAIPTPGSIALLGLGGLVAMRRRR
jgi:hypothetical protein